MSQILSSSLDVSGSIKTTFNGPVSGSTINLMDVKNIEYNGNIYTMTDELKYTAEDITYEGASVPRIERTFSTPTLDGTMFVQQGPDIFAVWSTQSGSAGDYTGRLRFVTDGTTGTDTDFRIDATDGRLFNASAVSTGLVRLGGSGLGELRIESQNTNFRSDIEVQGNIKSIDSAPGGGATNDFLELGPISYDSQNYTYTEQFSNKADNFNNEGANYPRAQRTIETVANDTTINEYMGPDMWAVWTDQATSPESFTSRIRLTTEGPFNLDTQLRLDATDARLFNNATVSTGQVRFGGSNLSELQIISQNTNFTTEVTFKDGTNVTAGRSKSQVQTLGIVANETYMDCSTGNFFQLFLSGDTTLYPVNVAPGQTISLKIVSFGDHSMSFGTNILWPDGTPPTIAPSATDIITFISYDLSDLFAVSVQNFA